MIIEAKTAQPAVGTDPCQKHAGAGSGLRPGGKAPSVFDGAYCILNLRVHSRLGGPRCAIKTAQRTKASSFAPRG